MATSKRCEVFRISSFSFHSKWCNRISVCHYSWYTPDTSGRILPRSHCRCESSSWKRVEDSVAQQLAVQVRCVQISEEITSPNENLVCKVNASFSGVSFEGHYSKGYHLIRFHRSRPGNTWWLSVDSRFREAAGCYSRETRVKYGSWKANVEAIGQPTLSTREFTRMDTLTLVWIVCCAWFSSWKMSMRQDYLRVMFRGWAHDTCGNQFYGE